MTTPLRDSKSNLYEAAVAAVKDREVAAAQAPRPDLVRPRRRGGMWFLLGLGLVGGALLLWQPVWLTGPDAPPPESPALAAASLRLSLLRERRRVTDFAQQHGRLPSTLSEAGSPLPELEFQPSGRDRFTLSGRVGDSLIVLRSTDSMETFLGGSLRVIKDRGRQ